jgi:hypothetical protein
MKHLKEKQEDLKRECDKTLISEIKNLELQVKREELRNKLASIKSRGVLLIFELPENNSKENKPSFFGNFGNVLNKKIK